MPDRNDMLDALDDYLPDQCPTCKGVGYSDYYESEEWCQTCGGTGRVYDAQDVLERDQ